MHARTAPSGVRASTRWCVMKPLPIRHASHTTIETAAICPDRAMAHEAAAAGRSTEHHEQA